MVNLEYRGKSAKVNIVLYEWLWDMLGGNVTPITVYTLSSYAAFKSAFKSNAFKKIMDAQISQNFLANPIF